MLIYTYAAFLDGLAGQGSDIDAIFEIEAQVVDDVINEHTRSFIAAGVASQPHSPSRASSTGPKTPKKDPRSESRSLQTSPPIRVPLPMSSPAQMSDFPNSASTHGDESPQQRGRMHDSSAHTSDDANRNGSATFEVFRQDSTDSDSRNLPTILRTPPARPALPPRHVRTRRDSHALQSFRMAALSNINTSNINDNLGQGSNADPFGLGPPMSSIPLNDGGIMPSPLGQLYGTVVIDGQVPVGSNGIGHGLPPPQARRLRTMSGGAALLEPSGLHHRRLSSGHSMRPAILGHSNEEFPETVQEVEDDAEEQEGETGVRSAAVLDMLSKMQEKQERIESQMQEILNALSRRA